jgi:hypothetical protein
MKVRLYARIHCSTCGPTNGFGGEVHVASVKVTIEKGVGSGNVVGSQTIKSPTLEGEIPSAWENWNKGPPIEFACEIGQEYKVTLAVVIDVTFGRTEAESVSAEEVCGHGRY